MRFNTRHLLITTAVVAVYCLGMALLASRGDLSVEKPRLWSLLVPLLLLTLFVWQTARIGRLHLFVRCSSVLRWVHVVLIAVYARMVYTSLALTRNVSLRMIVSFLLCHLVIETLSVVMLGNRGVSSGFQFFPWKDYEFTLETRTNRLLITARRKEAGEPLLRGTAIALPFDSLSKVQEILKHKQNVEAT